MRGVHEEGRGRCTAGGGVLGGEQEGAGARRHSLLDQGAVRGRREEARDLDPMQRRRVGRGRLGAARRGGQEDIGEREEAEVELPGEPDDIRGRVDHRRDVGRSWLVVLRLLPLRAVHVSDEELAAAQAVVGGRTGAGDDVWVLSTDPSLQEPPVKLTSDLADRFSVHVICPPLSFQSCLGALTHCSVETIRIKHNQNRLMIGSNCLRQLRIWKKS